MNMIIWASKYYESLVQVNNKYGTSLNYLSLTDFYNEIDNKIYGN